MTYFQIANGTSCHSLGFYQGDTPADAWSALCDDAGVICDDREMGDDIVITRAIDVIRRAAEDAIAVLKKGGAQSRAKMKAIHQIVADFSDSDDPRQAYVGINRKSRRHAFDIKVEFDGFPHGYTNANDGAILEMIDFIVETDFDWWDDDYNDDSN